jgi:hypothetical protein
LTRFLVGFFVLLFCYTKSVAQGTDFAYNHDKFSIDVKEKLTLTNNPLSITIGEAFSVAWSRFGRDVRNKIINQTKQLVADGHRLQPNLETYFASIAYAVNNENLSAAELVSYLNMTQQVIKNYAVSHELKYFERMKSFFEYRALHHTNYLDVSFYNDNYRFVYAKGVLLDEEDLADEQFPEEDTAYVEDEEWVEEEWQEEEYTEEEFTDESEEEVTLASLLEEAIVTRQLIGPTIIFDRGDLLIDVDYDSIGINNIKGSFLVMDNIFVGERGRVNWSTVGYDKEEVFAQLKGFELDVSKAQFLFRGAKLSYKNVFEQPIGGDIEFKPEKTADIKTNNYPKFTSLENNIAVQGLAGPYSYYKGGFTLEGRKISSEAKYSGKSTFRIESSGRPKFKIVAPKLIFIDSTVTTEMTRLVIYTKFDSIYHPAVRLRFDAKTNNLIVQKDRGGFRNTPYVSTANKMDFTADLLSWNIDQDSVYLSSLLGRKEVPLMFKSNEYYDRDIFSSLAGLYNFNPLKLVIVYCQREKVSQFYVEELADKNNLNLKNVQSAVMGLYQQGYVGYDKSTGIVTLTEKGFHKGEAQKGKADYDSVLLLSLMSSGTNAIFDLNTQEIHLNGVDKFYLAKVLDVSVTADNNQITILKNRDIKFDGKLAAGNFDYVGRDFIFRYDSFLVELQQIDAIEFYVLEDTPYGIRKRLISNSLAGIPKGGLQNAMDEANGVTGDSTAFDQTVPEETTPDFSVEVVASADRTQTSGILYISKPNNKSVRKLNANYPKFKGGGTGSVVYFDKPEILSGAYDRSIYFNLPPFDIDSLNDSDLAAVKFAGVFHSDNWFADFTEELHIMPDLSLGFDHGIAPEGYQLFGGNGRLYNRLSLNKQGLVGHGHLEYLTTKMISDNFVFYPDSVVADGISFNMKKEAFGGVKFPQMAAESFHLQWLPMKDSMYISNIASTFNMYEGEASLDGSVIITNKGVNGLGSLKTHNSITSSLEYTFNMEDYNARHAQFKIKSDIPEKPAFSGDDVRINFNLLTKQAEISPEVEGVAAISFPYAQFKTSITNARWDLENQKVYMSKPDEVDINSAYFYTTREDLDSLRFNATNAVYDMQSLELKVSGIPYIRVADADITPENGEVLVLENSRIGTLYNTTINLDTLNGYHEIYDATVTIVSRNEFEGEGTYRLINAVQDTFGIKLRDFHLEEFSDSNGKGKEMVQHTVAHGVVTEEDNLMLSPGMFYKGDVKLLAHKPALQLDGYVKLDLKSIKNYNNWIKYASEAEQQEIQFLFDESVTASGQLLSAGLHFDFNDNELYTTFCYDKRDDQDEDFFKPSGYLSFKVDSNEFVIINREKDLGNSYAGKVFAYDEATQNIRFEGPIHFVDNTKTMGIVASAIGAGNMETKELSFSSFLTMDFKLPSTIYSLMADDFVKEVEEFGAPEALDDRTELLYLLAEIIGNRAAKAYEEKSKLGYEPLVNTSPNMVKPFVFSNLKFRWSEDQKAFYNEGNLGLSNILRVDLNSQFEGFFEIRKTENGENINLFIKASPESWYYFSYENNKIFIYSSNSELNDFVNKKTNIGKAKIGEFQFGPSDLSETLAFINTFRAIYYDIDEPYDLQSEVSKDEKKTDDETDDDDDGF